MEQGSSMSAAARAWRAGRGDFRLYGLSVFSLAVAFVCLASSLLVVVNLHAVQARWARAGRASIYLRDGASEDDVATLSRALVQTKGVTSARYVSPADARKEIVGDGLEPALATLPAEAFPGSIEIEVERTLSDDELASMAAKLRGLPVVESVETYQRWTERLATLLHGGVMASALLAFIVLAAVVSVVAATVRMALQRRKIEIEVLKLVGATDGYVRGPFLVEGAVQGAMGSLAALGLLGVLFGIVRGRFDDSLAALLGTAPVFLPWYAMLGMIALGAMLGATAAFAGVRKLATV